jgi:hypothetical protein
MEADQKLEKLRAGFETLDDYQKDYMLGIADALAFANVSRKSGIPVSGPGKKPESPSAAQTPKPVSD